MNSDFEQFLRGLGRPDPAPTQSPQRIIAVAALERAAQLHGEEPGMAQAVLDVRKVDAAQVSFDDNLQTFRRREPRDAVLMALVPITAYWFVRARNHPATSEQISAKRFHVLALGALVELAQAQWSAMADPAAAVQTLIDQKVEQDGELYSFGWSFG